MEVVGATAAGIALCVYLTQAGTAIHKATKRIKHARQDIAKLSDETVLFAGLCEEFLRTCEDNTELRTRADSFIGPLNTWITSTKNELRKLLADIKALRLDPTDPQPIQTILIAHLKWLFSKSTVKNLRASMAVARETVRGFSNVMCITRLNEQLRMLKNALACPSSQREIEKQFGMAITKKIQSVEQAIEIRTSLRDTDKRLLKGARRNMIEQQHKSQSADPPPVPTELLEFTMLLDTYAEEILPSFRSRHRPDNFRSRSSNTISEHPDPVQRKPFKASTTGSHTNPSSSNISPVSSHIPIIDSSSVSDVSEVAEIPQARLRQKNVAMPTLRDTSIERPSMRAREYRNDPNGNILSPPKLVDRKVTGTPRRIVQFGRHTITLAPTRFTLNDNSLEVNDYTIAEAFFRAVIKHRDKLSELDHVLAMRHRMADDARWTGIPDWEITSRQIKCQSSGLELWGL